MNISITSEKAGTDVYPSVCVAIIGEKKGQIADENTSLFEMLDNFCKYLLLVEVKPKIEQLLPSLLEARNKLYDLQDDKRLRERKKEAMFFALVDSVKEGK